MIVEFTGCTGSGKTDLIARVHKRLQEGDIEVMRVRHLVGGSRVISWLPSEGWENVALELLLIPELLRCVVRRVEFLRLALRIATQYADSPPLVLKTLRGVWRQIGLFELALRRQGEADVVLVDEGTVHTAHYLFARLERRPQEAEVQEFCRQVPLPDLLVLVENAREVLIERLSRRLDPPMGKLDRVAVEVLVDHAQEVFERLKDSPRLARILMIVPCATQEPKTVDMIVDRITAGLKRGASDAQARP